MLKIIKIYHNLKILHTNFYATHVYPETNKQLHTYFEIVLVVY